MNWRPLQEYDLADCFAIYPPAVAACRPWDAHSVWAQLLKWYGFAGVAIERERMLGPKDIVGFGASIFLSEDFIQKEIAEFRPDLASRVIAAFVNHRPEILSVSEIAAANAGEGLTAFILAGRWAPALDSREKIEVQVQLATAFAELHSGYHLRRMLVELTDSQDLEHALSSNLWKIHPSKAQDGRAYHQFGLIEMADVLARTGSVLGPLFVKHEPKLGFRPLVQRLLFIALEGCPDPVLAKRLKQTVPQIKRLWAEAFNSVEESGVSIGLDDSMWSKNGKRGVQKRHLLLAYLRKHPEELRPYSASHRASA